MGSSWGPLGAPWRPFEVTLGPLCDILESLGHHLGAFWYHLVALNPLHRRRICELLESLGVSLGASRVPLGCLGSSLVSLGGSFGVSLQHLGALSATTWIHFDGIFLPPQSAAQAVECAFFDIFFVRVSHSPKFSVAFSVLFSLRSSCSVPLI